jgi:hypothetical protein
VTHARRSSHCAITSDANAIYLIVYDRCVRPNGDQRAVRTWRNFPAEFHTCFRAAAQAMRVARTAFGVRRGQGARTAGTPIGRAGPKISGDDLSAVRKMRGHAGELERFVFSAGLVVFERQ